MPGFRNQFFPPRKSFCFSFFRIQSEGEDGFRQIDLNRKVDKATRDKASLIPATLLFRHVTFVVGF